MNKQELLLTGGGIVYSHYGNQGKPTVLLLHINQNGLRINTDACTHAYCCYVHNRKEIDSSWISINR